MDPATNLAKDVAVNTLAGLQHPASAARRGYTVRTEEATRERPMGGDDSATLGRKRCEALPMCSSTEGSRIFLLYARLENSCGRRERGAPPSHNGRLRSWKWRHRPAPLSSGLS